jgi:predicted amidophosphoribosyltransferase
MVYCMKCGRELSGETNFCPKCGARTRKAIEEGINIPREELKEGLTAIGVEIEDALSEAGREIQRAFGEAREDIKKVAERQTLICPSCGEKNRSTASYCFGCGEKLD